MAIRRKRTDAKVSRRPFGEDGGAQRYAAKNERQKFDNDSPDDLTGDEGTDQSRRAPVFDEQKAREKVFVAALRLLSARSRSERQLRDKLLAKSWLDPNLIDDCLARLKELGYVNDREFALNYARSRLNIKSIGKSRLARELVEKKLSREIVDETLDAVFEEVAEDELIKRAIDKHTRLHGKPEDQKGAKKLMMYLLRLGFAYDLIARKLRAIRFEVDEEF